MRLNFNMINATDLKSGITFLSNDKPYKVIKYSHIKMGRGGAVVKVTARNLESGSVEERSFSSNVKVEEVSTQKRRLQFLYKDSEIAYFMDPKTYEQIAVPIKVLGSDLSYVKEGENVDILFWDQGPLVIELPPNVVLLVTETDPGLKGNSATNVYKPAVLENGLGVKVPLFINKGDKIRVDTRTGDYLERAK